MLSFIKHSFHIKQHHYYFKAKEKIQVFHMNVVSNTVNVTGILTVI
jgi:hypothetical protein